MGVRSRYPDGCRPPPAELEEEDGPWFPVMAAVWGLSVPTFMVVVLGFFFREDEDVLDADLSSSSRSDEFRKAPTANGTMHILRGVHMIGWYSVARTHAFIPTVCFWRERCEALFLC